MSEIYYLKTASRAAIAAAILAGTLDKRRPTIEADGGRFRVGEHAPTETAIESITVSTTGTTTLALKSQCADHIALVTAGAGSGAYTRKLVLPRLATAIDATTLAPITGDRITIRVSLAASTNPTIAIHENTDAGSLLVTLTGTGTATARTLQFLWNGSAWIVLNEGAAGGDSQPLDSDLTAIAALGTTSFGRALLTQADAAALRTTAGAQAADATLTSLAGKSLSGTGNVVLQSALDAVIAGLKFKQSVRVATAFSGTLATAFANGQTVDGVTLATRDRILIKNQPFPSTDNGIYVVNASGAPTRATDFDAAQEVPGALVAVERGTVNADTLWLCTNDAITLGTTLINFVPFGASGIPSQSEQGGKALVTNGSAMDWQAVGLLGESVTVQGYTSPAVAEAFAIAVIDYSSATIGADLTLGGITHTLLAPPTAGERPALEDMPAFSGWTLDDPAGEAWRYTKDAAGSTSASMAAGGGEPVLSFTNGNTATAAAGEIAEVMVIEGVAGKRIRGVAGYLECSGALGANTVALYHRTLDMESVETLTQITVPQNASGPFVLNHRLGAVGSESGESIILRFTGDVADYADPALTATAHVTCSQQ